jgi:hypothetical protein
MRLTEAVDERRASEAREAGQIGDEVRVRQAAFEHAGTRGMSERRPRVAATLYQETVESRKVRRSPRRFEACRRRPNRRRTKRDRREIERFRRR